MGENLNLMEALYITVSSMLMVFLILLLICGVLSVFKSIFKSETVERTNGITHSKNNIVENNLEVDEDEKVIVALIASIAAGEGIDKPNLHIKRITRIS